MKSGVDQLAETSEQLRVSKSNSCSNQIPTLNSDSRVSWTPLTVPIRTDSQCGKSNQPLSVGIPLPHGRVFAPCQASVSLPGTVTQMETLAYWPDRSIRWLLVHFRTEKNIKDIDQLQIQLSPGEEVDSSPVQINHGGPTEIELVVSDQLRLQFSTEALNISLKESSIHASARLILTDTHSQQHTVQFEKAEIENQGSVCSTVLLSGKVISHHAGKRFLNCRVRMSCYQGLKRLKLKVTLHNPHRAAHHGGLWDLGDEGSVFFKSWHLEFSTECGSQVAKERVAWIAESDSNSVAYGGSVEIYQDSSGGENWHSPVHVNRSGRVPCQFRGYRLTQDDQQTTGLRATPVAGVLKEQLVMAVGVEDFWQQFPLSLKASSEGIQVGLFPSNWSDQFELQGGEQKTHYIWMELSNQTDANSNILETLLPSLHQVVHHPAHVRCDSEWYVKACAMPWLLSAEQDRSSPVCRQILEAALTGELSLFEKRETIDEYGWRNYGDVWADHEQVYYEGQGLVVSHYNNQFDMIAGGVRQWMQSGDRRWWCFFAPLARHVLDIDIYRTQQDRAAYNGGLFWFTDHYFSAATATHRTFSRHNSPSHHDPTKQSDYGGGPGSEHNFSTGLLYYYWLTGDRDAAEGVRILADWVLAMDDGSQNIWGVFDSGPTGLATMSGSLEYQGPGRGAANSMQVLLDGWLLTRDLIYLVKCESIIRRVIHPDDDISSLHLLDAESRWSYTMLLAALIRYLEVKIEEDQLDAAYAYAYESLSAYARWMAKYEKPYLDQPEQLEFPTEAWAVQDLRKANVMRIAANLLGGLSDEEAAELRERGTQIANRSWEDLRNFETRQTTRSVAIVMTEGSIDGYLRATAEFQKLPLPETEHGFGVPKKFVPQKIRLRSSLRTPGGIVRLLLTPFQPTAWRIVIRQISRNFS